MTNSTPTTVTDRVMRLLNDHDQAGGRWMSTSEIVRALDEDRYVVVLALKTLHQTGHVINAAPDRPHYWSITTVGAAACAQMNLGEAA